jgi:molecular chaperone GrpE
MAKAKNESQQEELRGQLQRALADYANLTRRVEEEKKAVVKFANVVLLAKFLEVLDSLEAAQKVIGSEGLELVVQKFRSALESEGAAEIATKPGENFDPNLHEAIDSVESSEEGKVVEILRKGYQIDGKVIRPAHVRVSRKLQSQAAKETAGG